MGNLLRSWVVHYLQINYATSVKDIVAKAIQESGEEVPSGNFEVTHVVSVYLANAIKEKVKNADKKFYSKMDAVDKLLEQFLEMFTTTQLTNNQLAKLPKKAVFSYSIYESDLKNVVVDSSEQSNSCTKILICMRARDEATETNIYAG